MFHSKWIGSVLGGMELSIDPFTTKGMTLLVKLTSLKKAQIIRQMQWFPLKSGFFDSHLECLASKELAEISLYLWLVGAWSLQRESDLNIPLLFINLETISESLLGLGVITLSFIMRDWTWGPELLRGQCKMWTDCLTSPLTSLGSLPTLLRGPWIHTEGPNMREQWQFSCSLDGIMGLKVMVKIQAKSAQ